MRARCNLEEVHARPARTQISAAVDNLEVTIDLTVRFQVAQHCIFGSRRNTILSSSATVALSCTIRSLTKFIQSQLRLKWAPCKPCFTPHFSPKFPSIIVCELAYEYCIARLSCVYENEHCWSAYHSLTYTLRLELLFSDKQNSIDIAITFGYNTLQEWGKTRCNTLYVVIHDSILYVMTAVTQYKIVNVDSL